jgi:hypothetical protein
MGPVIMNVGEAFKLDAFDKDLIAEEISRFRLLLKSRNHTDAVEALISLEALGRFIFKFRTS